MQQADSIESTRMSKLQVMDSQIRHNSMYEDDRTLANDTRLVEGMGGFAQLNEPTSLID